jgi:predicted nuclease of predicted toxin-antitoxin system
VRFLVDAQLPPLLADWLREQGHKADHVYALSDLCIDDNAIWELAVRDGYIVVTKDRDFADWVFSRQPAPRVLWLRFGNCRNQALKRQLAAAWPRALAALKEDRVVVEVV